MKLPYLDSDILVTALLAALAVSVSTPVQTDLAAHSSIQLALTALFSQH